MMLTRAQERAILMKQQDNMDRPSETRGLLHIPFEDNLRKDAGPILATEMAARGHSVSLANLSHKHFARLKPFRRGLPPGSVPSWL